MFLCLFLRAIIAMALRIWIHIDAILLSKKIKFNAQWLPKDNLAHIHSSAHPLFIM